MTRAPANDGQDEEVFSEIQVGLEEVDSVIICDEGVVRKVQVGVGLENLKKSFLTLHLCLSPTPSLIRF